MEYEKVKQEINDIVGDNVKKLAQLFPSVVKDGEVDFEALKEELGQFTEVGPEKYELTWAGKQQAKKIAQQDIIGKTLKYIPEDSKDADTTENLYIEGDNLEVLKLLRQNYYGAIKMIYIDPPYNTGNDFVYKDNFVMSEADSAIAEGNMDELGEKYKINSKSQNRYHANWLNMMYPRLKIAKDLLHEEGVLFISIDDNEYGNLKQITDDVFGIDSFVTVLHVELSATQGMKVKAAQNGNIVKNAEYILVYSKDGHKNVAKNILYDNRPGYDEHYSKFLCGEKLVSVKEIFHNEYPDIEVSNLKSMYNEESDFRSFIENNLKNIFADDKIAGMDINDYEVDKVYNVMREGKEYRVINNGKKMRQLLCLADSYGYSDDFNHTYGLRKIRGDWWKEFYKDMGNVSKEGDMVFANGKKPVRLIQQLVRMCTDDKDIIIDFFSGSATTAHAVMAENVRSNGQRKYIMVQIPEICSDAMKNGFNNICDIGKERICRAGDKLKQEYPGSSVDVGFKVFRVADTNIKWNSLMDVGQVNVSQLETTPDLVDFMPGTNDIDVVYELMLRQRDVALSETLEALTEIGSRTYLYASSYLVCLETEITEELVDQLAAIDPLPVKFIFRDSAFKDDIALKDETFRRLKTLIEKNSGNRKQSYTVEFI